MMLILAIILIIAVAFWIGVSFKFTIGKTSFSAELGEVSDGYGDTICRKCGGNSFTVKTTDLHPLGVIRRSVTETICQMCGETVFKIYNTFREKQETEL